MDIWMVGCEDGWMDEWMDGYVHICRGGCKGR